jgi:hypothetical protein
VTPHDKRELKTTFFTTVSRSYWPFVAPYAASTFLHNDDVRMELCVEDFEDFVLTHQRALRRVVHHFPGRLLLRDGKFRKRSAEIARFLETPEVLTEYTYIGDLDILILERHVTAQHVENMARIGLPYSNVVREGGPHKLSGLHFTRSDAYYPIKIPKGWDLNANCEVTLQALVLARGHALPGPDAKFRPMHGLHLSLNRRPIGTGHPHWGIRNNYIDAYLALWESPVWQDIAQHFHPAYSGLLQTLEAVMQTMRPDQPIFRQRDARQWFISIADKPW